MISNIEAATELAWAYGYPDPATGNQLPPYPWSFRLPGDTVRGGVRRFPDFNLVLFPGTEDVREWYLNVAAVPTTDPPHPQWGMLPWGFATGIDQATAALDAALDPALPSFVVAHSRGCPHAFVYALGSSKKPAHVLAMGSPRPGTSVLQQAWADAAISSISCRTVNIHDPSKDDDVTEVPFYVPAIAPFTPIMAYTDLPVIPLPNDPWGPLALHHEDTMYLAGLKARGP